MAGKRKAGKADTAKKAKTVAVKEVKAAQSKAPKARKPKAKKGSKPPSPASDEKARILSSEVVFEGPLFRVLRDRIVEPGGVESQRDVIRHNGSVVILALDNAKNRKNPWVVVERQYRHAANRFLWELPAGKLDAGEEPLAGAQRELEEETGYRAKKWKPLVEYFASPGFLGEAMKIFLAEGLVTGEAHPEEDEKIEIRLIKLNDILKMIDKGMIQDGKTLTAILLYARKAKNK